MASINANPPRTMSAAGLSVSWVVSTMLEPANEYSINRPSGMLIAIAPSQYPSMSLNGFGRRSITVVAVISVGFSADVRERRTTWPMPNGA